MTVAVRPPPQRRRFAGLLEYPRTILVGLWWWWTRRTWVEHDAEAECCEE